MGPGSLQEGHGTAADAWALHRPSGRDVGIMAVAVVGISLSAPLTTMLAAPMLALAFWRNVGGAAALLPVLLRGRSVLAGLRPGDLTSSVLAGGSSSPRTSRPGCRACR
jgi:hypothetical protein